MKQHLKALNTRLLRQKGKVFAPKKAVLTLILHL